MLESLKELGYTDDQINIILQYIEKCKGEYECLDNIRIAREDNPDEYSKYYEIRDSGCCGFHDTLLQHPDGHIMVGFNYGH